MRRVVYAAMILIIATPVSGQQASPSSPSYVLDGLVVTGVPQPRAETAMGNTVTVLDGLELRAAGVTRVTDALRSVPGLALVEGGSFGGVVSLFLRGAESDYVQVLIDGVQVNQPGGSFDFSGLTTDNVERIEILRGPASALYGSDAVGGVIHIITRGGSGGPRGTASIRGGSYGRQEWSLDLHGGTESVSYGFALSDNQTDGILEFNNAFSNQVLSGVVRFVPDERSLIEVSARLGNRKFHFPTDGSGNVVDQNAFSYADEAALGLDAERQVTERVRVDFTLSSYESDGGTDDAIDGPADTLGFYAFTSLNAVRRTTARAQSHMLLGESTTGTIGVELGDQEQRSFSESKSQYGPSNGESRNERWNRAGFIHVVSSVRALNVNGGARIEDNELFGRSATWQLGASWSYAASGRVRGAAGTGIKEPTFFENYATGFATGNPDLDPERSTSWEIGVEQDLIEGVLQFSGAWFDQNFQDLIQYTFAPPNPRDPNYFNVAEARARGMEAGLMLSTGSIAASTDITWLDTEVVDSGFDSGEGATFVEGGRLLRRPRVVIGGSLRYRHARGSLHASMRRIGEREDRDFSTFPATSVTLDAYTLLGVGAEVSIIEGTSGSSLALTVRGQNLLDAGYQEVFGFAAPGRQFYLGARVGIGGR